MVRYILSHESLVKTIIEGDFEWYVGIKIPRKEYINRKKYKGINF